MEQVVPGFELGEVIGRGGFGVVYRARQIGLDRDVAVKVLAASVVDDPTAVSRFERECAALGRLSQNPAIVSVHAVGRTTTGVPYIAMELMTGGSLSQRAPLASDETVALGRQLASALELSHAAGIVHRDVKPSNVLFDDSGSAVLADFGLASLVGSGATASTSITASLSYAAPEVLEGAPATPAADVYGLGATLFFAASGRAPFTVGQDAALSAVVTKVLSSPVEDLRREGVPVALCQVIERAMAKRPTDRFPDAGAMLRALDGEPAAPVQFLPAAPAWMRRLTSRAAVLTLLVVVVAGVIAQRMGADRHSNDPPAASSTGIPSLPVGAAPGSAVTATTNVVSTEAGVHPTAHPGTSTGPGGVTPTDSQQQQAAIQPLGAGAIQTLRPSQGSSSSPIAVAKRRSAATQAPTFRPSGGAATHAATGSSGPVGGSGAGVNAPGAPTAASVSGIRITHRVNGVSSNQADQLAVTLQWSAPSSGDAATSYCVRYTRLNGTSADGPHTPVAVPTNAACQAGTTQTITVGRDDDGAYAYLEWEVQAVNAGGHSDWTQVTAITVPSVVGTKNWDATPLGRDAGLQVGNAVAGSPPSPDRAEEVIGQDPAAGTVDQPGDLLTLTEYGD